MLKAMSNFILSVQAWRDIHFEQFYTLCSPNIMEALNSFILFVIHKSIPGFLKSVLTTVIPSLSSYTVVAKIKGKEQRPQINLKPISMLF